MPTSLFLTINQSKSDKMIISTLDFEVLMKCIRAVEGRHTTGLEEIQLLKRKFSLAGMFKPQNVPQNIVTMNSFVELQQKHTDHSFAIKLVYPDYANKLENRISVFSALGAAIFAQKIEDEVVYNTWKENRIKIIDVLFQPEANGNYYANKYDYCHF